METPLFYVLENDCIMVICFQRFKLISEQTRGQNGVTLYVLVVFSYMMTSSNGSIFRVTGHLRGEFTGDRTKASDAELWYFLWPAPE